MEAPKLHTLAPDFSLPDANGKQVKLSDYRGRVVVLVFYCGDWTPVCDRQLTLLQDTLDQIHEYGAEVLAVSSDTSASHRAWANAKHLTFPMLSDFWPHGALASRYGVFDVRTGTSGRALFIVDSTGTLRRTWLTHNPDIAPGLDIVFDALDEMASRESDGRHAP